ncbi:hypothetical protein SAMN04487859_1223 [Roseovarius lutimaris]|uniref:Uncharacterized protein n=1 Tax=Roseovarius lutimaris TaxID=1005928 RepID=A0A1I5FTN4_9RHOB|nr:hypothetical protein [Roseovarius lutimaris]SFO27092.1 hypothetical protein SAMN04487859_1223 [Roseovarius lutimaris]
MTFTPGDVHDLRRRSREQARQAFAGLALAGVRRPAYAGDFQRLAGTKIPTYICDLILDGHQRNLTIRLKMEAREVDQENIRHRYMATIQGLRFSLNQGPFDLFEHNPKNERACLKGVMDLGATQLVMTVLPHYTAHGFNPWICVLETLRPEG